MLLILHEIFLIGSLIYTEGRKMKKIILTTLLASVAMSAAPASAEIFTYEVEGNNRQSAGGGTTILKIDTATGQASLIGGNINATFTGDFSSFTGGATPDRNSFAISNLTGTRDVNGNSLNVTDPSNSTHPYSLVLDGEGGINLWAHWGGGTRYGDYLATTTGYTPPPPPPASTSTGGLTSTGGVSTSSTSTGGGTPTGSTGGSDVPAPGALFLMGLGIAGLAFGNRRRKK